jgi:hypothetical protein
MNQIGGEVKQRNENEAAQVDSRMWCDQDLIGTNFFAEEEDVDIDCAGPPRLLSSSPELFLGGKTVLEQFLGLKGGLHRQNSIEVKALACRSADRLCLVNGRRGQNGKSVNSVKSLSGRLQEGKPITEIGAKRQVCSSFVPHVHPEVEIKPQASKTVNVWRRAGTKSPPRTGPLTIFVPH